MDNNFEVNGQNLYKMSKKYLILHNFIMIKMFENYDKNVEICEKYLHITKYSPNKETITRVPNSITFGI